MSGEYEGFRRVYYWNDDQDRAVFVPVCPRCGRFVAADASVSWNANGKVAEPNATCRRCGRVAMPFEGFL